ncbi:FtsH protease activity modulator HflK [Candidatus Persebacteraceae bacterium Df01]|jgi:membrane protease subunit HflK|uniref:Protein HflK n=1 Tax=Candidatus Doriopsillibacter californiensis TaxID=2970740 RepID=A0ABT7QJC0_9GAMM|nr:FtsH protease activity modulator HflK [Candidatus Persebacteraceae bacterium Df01]
MNFFSQNQLPDIDELLRRLVKRLGGEKKNSQMFSRNAGDFNEDNDDPSDGIVLPPLRYLSALLCIGLVLMWVLAGFFTVDAAERAVMFRLGNPSGIKTPGLAWHMPLIENYRIVNLTEVQRVEIGFRNDTKRKNPRESLMLTGDLNIIDTQFVVQYAFNDPRQFLFENRFSSARAQDVVKQVAETAMREVVGKSEIDFVLYEGREAVASETKQTMQHILDRYKTGIQVREVAVQNAQPPDQVQDAFEDAIRARKDKDRKINEGKAYANDILPRAKGQGARILEDAEAYRRNAIERALGDTERFLLVANEFSKAPKITRRRLYLETMEEVMGRANKVIVDQKDSGNLLYLPLDKLMQAGGAAAAASQSSITDKETTPSGLRTLDELKKRLREGSQSGLDALENRR